MTTATLARPTGGIGSVSAGTGRLTFPHLVRSEWIKFWSLRSTLWTIGITVVAMAAMATMIAFAVDSFAGVGLGGDQMALTVVTFGYMFGQISVAVLGALIITGEYSTGMIRSTFAADPGRVGAILAKGLVLAVVVFVTSLAGVALSYLTTLPILSGSDIAVNFASSETWRVIFGTGGYLTLIALLAFALGIILRNSAGTIAAVLAILLVLPTVMNIVMGLGQDWATTLMPYLPSLAGEQLMAFEYEAGSMYTYEPLTWWQGGLALLGYVTVLTGVGLALVRSRDA